MVFYHIIYHHNEISFQHLVSKVISIISQINVIHSLFHWWHNPFHNGNWDHQTSLLLNRYLTVWHNHMTMMNLVCWYCPTCLSETSPRCHFHVLLASHSPCQAIYIANIKYYTYPYVNHIAMTFVMKPPISSLTSCSRFSWLHWHPLKHAYFLTPFLPSPYCT